MATGMPALGILDRQLNKVVGGIVDEIVNELKGEEMVFGDLRCPLHKFYHYHFSLVVAHSLL